MKKDFIKKIVRNIIHEVSKEFDVIFDVKIGMEFNDSIEFYFNSMGTLERGVTVREGFRGGYSVSHGIHSPSDTKSDLLQQIICGRVADRLFKENFK